MLNVGRLKFEVEARLSGTSVAVGPAPRPGHVLATALK
jgi:hypothetical protein